MASKLERALVCFAFAYCQLHKQLQAALAQHSLQLVHQAHAECLQSLPTWLCRWPERRLALAQRHLGPPASAADLVAASASRHRLWPPAAAALAPLVPGQLRSWQTCAAPLHSLVVHQSFCTAQRSVAAERPVRHMTRRKINHVLELDCRHDVAFCQVELASTDCSSHAPAHCVIAWRQRHYACHGDCAMGWPEAKEALVRGRDAHTTCCVTAHRKVYFMTSHGGLCSACLLVAACTVCKLMLSLASN